MRLVLLLIDCLPLFSSLMVLWLSWYMMLSLILYPFSFSKYWVHIAWVRTSYNLTSSDSVEILVFSFCFWNANRLLLFPWSWSHQYGSSLTYVLQTMHQYTNVCFLICLLIGTVVVQYFLVFTPSPSIYSSIHKCQALSLYFTVKILLAGCMGVPSLKYIAFVLQNGEKDLCWYGKARLYLLQCQRCGVQKVWLTPPSRLM